MNDKVTRLVAAAAAIAAFALIAGSFTSCATRAENDDPYVQEINKWHADREDRLRREDGWLSLAGLFLLQEGANSFGSDDDNDLVFPKKSPAHAGVIHVTGGRASIEVRKGERVTHDAEPIESKVIFTGDSDETAVIEIGALRFFVIERVGKLYIRLKDTDSQVRKDFTTIERFAVAAKWRFEVKFERYDPPKKVSTPNIMGYVEEEDCPGAAVFEIDGKTYRLEPTIDEGMLFFVYGDETSGRETYGGGRYFYTDLPNENGIVVLDFNKGYNPPCVFTPYATCPLPRPENMLPIRITAGEKQYRGDH